jgi:hypothetical protein
MRSLLEQPFADGDRAEATPTTRGAEYCCLRETTQVSLAENLSHPVFRDVDLDEARNYEPHDNGPGCCPEEPDADP